MDYAKFIKNRITQLRIKKNVSEYQMSLDLGHSKSYIQGISSGRALPSMSEFIAICEYFGITPKAFFDDEISDPIMLQRLLDSFKNLSEEDTELILKLVEKLK